MHCEDKFGFDFFPQTKRYCQQKNERRYEKTYLDIKFVFGTFQIIYFIDWLLDEVTSDGDIFLEHFG